MLGGSAARAVNWERWSRKNRFHFHAVFYLRLAYITSLSTTTRATRRSVKKGEVYLHAYDRVSEARAGMGDNSISTITAARIR